MINKMINKLKMWLYSKRMINKEISTPTIAPTIQEDPTNVEARKLVRKLFKQQQNQMNVRRAIPHSFSCKAPDICTDRKCFKIIADNIVKELVVLETKDIRNNE